MTTLQTKTNSTVSTIAKTTVLVEPVKPVIPRLYYLPHVWNQIQYIVQASPKEVGWWGLVDKIENDYVVTALYVPPQTVTGAETDITADAMANLAVEIINAGDDPSKLYYWGHSHVNMGVSPSGQDETQVRDYLTSCPVFIRGIYNKAGQNKVDIYDVEQNVCFETVTNGPAHPQLSDDDKALLDKLLTANVKPAVVTTYPNTTVNSGYDWRNQNTGHYRREIEPLPDVKAKETPAAREVKEVSPTDSSGFFLIGVNSLDYYHELDANDYATLHAHIYN